MNNPKYVHFVLLFLCLHSVFTFSQETAPEDPFIWLEDIDSEKSLNWVREQNKKSAASLESNPIYGELKQKYKQVYNNKDKIAYPNVVGDFVYNFWQDGNYERGIWRRMPIKDYLKNKSNWEELLNLDDLSEKEGKKWVFSSSSFLGPENNICLIYLSDGGKDENVGREFDLIKKQFVNQGFDFEESKGNNSWIDRNTVLSGRNFGSGTMTSSGYPRQIRILKRGEPIDDAKVLFETDSTRLGVFPLTYHEEGETYAFIYEAITIFETDLYYLNGSQLQKINCPSDANFAGYHKGELIFSLQSDWNLNGTSYKKGMLISLNLKDNLEGKVTLKKLYEPDDRSSYVSLSPCRDFVLVNTMENVQNRLLKVSLDNDHWVSEAIESPEFGSISWMNSDNLSNQYFFSFSNFVTPTTLYYSKGTKTRAVKSLKSFFDASNQVIEQFNAVSKDGTEVPYFIVHDKNLQYNGQNPTLIYAYGGFNVSSQPNYSATTGLGWLEKGGVYVLANIRGGGEFGPSWHQDAMKEKKQNSYDDFYAVTEDLIRRKITSPSYIGAFGGSNGGLMAGVLYTQRPELYNAVCLAVPLLDMKRYSKLLAGASWMGEYGNPDIPEEWEYIKKYSPYHNISREKSYPEVYFVTSSKDDRVHPGHARKMAAKMEEMGHPYLFHETIEGGHGAASTTAQQAEMWAGIFAYFNMKLNVKPLDKQ